MPRKSEPALRAIDLVPRDEHCYDGVLGLLGVPWFTMSIAKAGWIRAPRTPLVYLYGVLVGLLLFSATLLAMGRWSRLASLGLILDGELASWDFLIYYTAGYLARAGLGDQIYDLAAQGFWQEELTGQIDDRAAVGFAYLPHFAVALIPFSWFPYGAAERLWFGLNAATLIVLGLVLWRLAAPAAHWQRLLLLACVASSDPVFSVMRAGQVSAFMVLALATSLLLLRQGRETAAGAALAIMTIKPQLLVGVLLLFVLRARRRALLGLAVPAGALALVPLLVLGPNVYVEQLRFLFSQSGPDGLVGVYYAHMHSWRGLLATLQLDGNEIIYVATFVLMVLASALLALWAWRVGPAQGDGQGNQEWAVALLLPLLLTPHLWTHDLLVLALVGALMLSQLAQAPTDLLHDLRVAALVLGGYVILSEMWFLTRQNISLTILALLGAFVWTCLRRWGSTNSLDTRQLRTEPDALAA